MTQQQQHETARRAAMRCRQAIQGILREEEYRDADQAFYDIIMEELTRASKHEAGRTVRGG